MATTVALFSLTWHGLGGLGVASRSSSVVMGGTSAGNARLESVGSIFEFDDGKHPHPLLGVVESADIKGKKGAVYTVRDSSNRQHNVPAKHIHCKFTMDATVKPMDSTNPDVVLVPYMEVAALEPHMLGIDLESLELAWEMCAEEDAEENHKGHSAKSVVSMIDESLYATPVDAYKAYRLLSSSLGKMYFNKLHAHDYAATEYKAKSPQAVADSKQALCAEDAEAPEWCFV
jgi:hypothetical protein